MPAGAAGQLAGPRRQRARKSRRATEGGVTEEPCGFKTVCSRSGREGMAFNAERGRGVPRGVRAGLVRGGGRGLQMSPPVGTQQPGRRALASQRRALGGGGRCSICPVGEGEEAGPCDEPAKGKRSGSASATRHCLV